MAKKGPVIQFREGFDTDRKFCLHALAHFDAAWIMVRHEGDDRRIEENLLSFALDCLGHYIDGGQGLWVDDVEVYRTPKADL